MYSRCLKLFFAIFSGFPINAIEGCANSTTQLEKDKLNTKCYILQLNICFLVTSPNFVWVEVYLVHDVSLVWDLVYVGNNSPFTVKRMSCVIRNLFF